MCLPKKGIVIYISFLLPITLALLSVRLDGVLCSMAEICIIILSRLSLKLT